MDTTGQANVRETFAVTIRAIVFWCAAVLILGAMALPLFQNQVFLFDDLGSFHLPLRTFYSTCLEKGDSFDWFPQMFCGFDLHGEGQIGMYHPFHLLLYKFLPFNVAFTSEFLASYVALFVGTFLLFKRLGFPNDGASLAALAFAFSGNPLFRYMHMNGVAIMAHLPWLLLSADLVLRSPSRRVAALGNVGVSLLTASQLLLGYPQWFWISLLIEGLFYLYTVRQQGTWSRLPALFWAKALGVLVGAVQLIPTFQAISLSERINASREFRETGSLNPINLASLVSPYIYQDRALEGGDYVPPHEFGLFNGTIVVVLLLWLVIRGVDLRWRSLAWAAFSLSLLGLGLSLGKYTPLINILNILPVASMFRCPARYLLLFNLGNVTLAAIAFCQMAHSRDAIRPTGHQLRLLFLIPAAGLLLFAAVAFWRTSHPDSWFIQQISPSFVVIPSLLVVLMITSLAALAARGHRHALMGLVIVAGLDQLVFAISYLYQHAPEPIDSLVEVDQPRLDFPGYRLAGGNHYFGSPHSAVKFSMNTFTMKGTSLVNGYVGLKPRRNLDYKKQASLRVAGAGWVWKEFFVKDTSEKNFPGEWEPVPDPLPRFRLVTNSAVSSDFDNELARIELATTAIVSEDLKLPNGPPGTVRSLFDRPGLIGLAAECPSRQLLVVGESFHPGWTTTLDGVPVPTIRVNGDFLGCLVDSGQHEVIFRYHPPGLRTGGLVTACGLLLVIATWVYCWYR